MSKEYEDISMATAEQFAELSQQFKEDQFAYIQKRHLAELFDNMSTTLREQTAVTNKILDLQDRMLAILEGPAEQEDQAASASIKDTAS